MYLTQNPNLLRRAYVLRCHNESRADLPAVARVVSHGHAKFPGRDRAGARGHEIQVIRKEDWDVAVAVQVKERTAQLRGERWNIKRAQKRIGQLLVPVSGASDMDRAKGVGDDGPRGEVGRGSRRSRRGDDHPGAVNSTPVGEVICPESRAWLKP